MKNLPRRQILNSIWVALLLCIRPLAWGQETTLLITGPRETVSAGGTVSLWLNVLNQSGREISWAFPTNLGCRLVAAPLVLEGVLDLHQPSEAGPMVIASGAFARKEYLLALPAKVSGHVTVEFPDLAANPVVLNVQATTAAARAQEQRKKDALSVFIQDAALDAPGQPYDPGRFFKEHISGYEPMYFLAGSESPTAKFQISIQYQLLNSYGWLAERAPALKGFHLAYTQTSLWDLAADSAPFFDSSYKPEVLYAWERVLGGRSSNWFRLDLQVGLQHESNGKDGADSRSLNFAYLRPTMIFGQNDGLQFTLQPRAWVYVGDLDSNPDLPDYRGYADLRAILGWQRGLQLSAIGRMGDHGDHISLQLDVTYPLMRLLANSFTMYLQAQYFTGYGESLLRYDERGHSFRIGLALYR